MGFVVWCYTWTVHASVLSFYCLFLFVVFHLVLVCSHPTHLSPLLFWGTFLAGCVSRFIDRNGRQPTRCGFMLTRSSRNKETACTRLTVHTLTCPVYCPSLGYAKTAPAWRCCSVIDLSARIEWRAKFSQSAHVNETHNSFDLYYYPPVQNHFITVYCHSMKGPGWSYTRGREREKNKGGGGVVS